MADAAVENPALTVPPHKKTSNTSIPTAELLGGAGGDGGDEYSELKKLQRHLEYGAPPRTRCGAGAHPLHRYINLQEEYIKDEQRYCCTQPSPRRV